MRWLNYHHLFYFWSVARRGSITEACHELKLSQPTISAQLRSLEESLGEKLFKKQGRYLQLTDTGRVAFRYAEQIFALGGEMFDLIEGKSTGRPEIVRIGVSDVMPKLLVRQIIDPIFDLKPCPKVIFVENRSERLLAELGIHELDLVLSDCPIPPSIHVRAYNHELGSSSVSFLAPERICQKHKKRFPGCLAELPVLLPAAVTVIRRELDMWFERLGINPFVIAEFEDSALMKTFARSGRGVVPIPTIVEHIARKDLGLRVLGRVTEVQERFYLISVERKVRHPVVAKILENARLVFANQ